MSQSQKMGVHLPLSPEMRRMVERYHRSEIPIENLDEAFMSIVSNETALDYLASLDQQQDTAVEASHVPTCAPADVVDVTEISAAASPAQGPKCAPATAPMPVVGTKPAVQRAVAGESTLKSSIPVISDSIPSMTLSHSVAPKPPGMVLRAFACITLGVLVGIVYWFQPQNKSTARSIQQPHHVGISAN